MGFLSQNLLKSFWGSNVEAMVALVYDKLAKGAKFEAAIPGWGKHKRVISVEEVTGIGMGAVTYPGDGKYNPCLDVAVRWEDMLQDLPPADKERFERLIDDDCRKEGGFKAPEGRGWWPICIVSWRTEAADCGFRGSPQQYREKQQLGTCVVWALCWYQLLDGTWIMVLWPVYLLSRSRL